MHHRTLVALALLPALCGTQLLAWSPEGHQAVAMIAEQLLQESGNFPAVQQVLGKLSLADIATCPDEIREVTRGDGSQMSPICKAIFPDPPKGTGGWHFVDISVKILTPTRQDVAAACSNKCVVTQIVDFGQVLADTTEPQSARLQALSFVVHFIGDVHQPLHAAERDGDAGGNAEQVEINGAKTSLHHAWDDELVSLLGSDPRTLANDLALYVRVAQIEPKIQVEDWAIQSFQFARADAYAGVPPANGSQIVARLWPAYQQTAGPIIRLQIARAGVRLAQFLSEKMANAAAGSAAQ